MIPPSALKSLLADASEYQRGVLEDGQLTFSEYEAAVFATVACLKQAGFTIAQGPELSTTRVFEYTVAIDMPPEESQPLYMSCYVTYQSIIDQAWVGVGQLNPSEKQLIDAERALSECLAQHGFQPPEDANLLARFVSTVDDRDVVQQCVIQVEAATGVEGFVGR